MNKLGKLLAAVVISGLSSVSLAESRFHALAGEVRLGDNLAQGHLRSQNGIRTVKLWGTWMISSSRTW